VTWRRNRPNRAHEAVFSRGRNEVPPLTRQNGHVITDVIEPSSGPWASPIVLIPKPDGSIRFCVDYRRLNAMARKDSYALPRMDDCIVRVLVGPPRVRAVRKSYKIVEARMAYRMIV
jgi:hypothetical protein